MKLNARQAMGRTLELMAEVGIPNPKERLRKSSPASILAFNSVARMVLPAAASCAASDTSSDGRSFAESQSQRATKIQNDSLAKSS